MRANTQCARLATASVAVVQVRDYNG